MAGTREETIRGGAGALYVRAWLPDEPPRALVAFCHGFNAHSGYYPWVGEQCAAAGYAACAVDLRGRGKSGGVRYYVEHFDDYVSDLAALVAHARTLVPAVPLFVLGHSAGGVIACLYALEHGAELAGLICEDFAFEVPAPDFALQVLKGISHLAPRARALRLKNADFSRDPNVLQTMNDDPLIEGEAQPFATVAALVRANERLKQSFPSLVLPLLILHGTADNAARPSGSEYFFERAGAQDKTLQLYEGRLHDPLNDIGKAEVMADVLRWIAARTPSAPV
ncbi:alpha-beta hydrolase superfamily lysophospholipase [Silvimonas terrae]|uniref:Alpha-beta hydrolase superfamily lysophospholipase n=1 Tax=Silvimonas terrae TaxID=300266 RepID=A0A840R8X2_9NEIS|nr:alpha/beta hydrolase [Silvimonas terrae]MBB5189785.1 alpha-beta hydrolase superfamily lysophospholipase [Silvimonas terrae]